MMMAGRRMAYFTCPFFQRLVQLRLGKGGVGAEHHLLAQQLLAFNLGQQQFLPALGAGNVARP